MQQETIFEIPLDYTQSEFSQYEMLLSQWGQMSMAISGAQLVGISFAISGLASLVAIASGVSTNKGGVVAVLAFWCFYIGLWTPSVGASLTRTKRLTIFNAEVGNRLIITDTGILVNQETGWQRFISYSHLRSARIKNSLLVLSLKLGKPFAVPIRLLTSEQQAQLIKLVEQTN